MSSEFWRQWQALASPFGWNIESPSAPTGSAAPGFGPFADSAARFAAAVREFVANTGRTHPSSTAASDAAFAAAEGFGNFLRDHFAGYFKPPWPSATPAPLGSAFAEAPALGLGREQVLRAQRALAAWNRLTEAQGRLHRMWSDTLRTAAAAFTAQLEPAGGESLTSEAVDRLYDRWIDCAEEAYGRIAHSDGFCDALSACVNAGSEWRRECAAGIEEWAKLLDLPTRSEISTLTQRVRELEMQLAAAKMRPGRKRSAKPRAARSKRSS